MGTINQNVRLTVYPSQPVFVLKQLNGLRCFSTQRLPSEAILHCKLMDWSISSASRYRGPLVAIADLPTACSAVSKYQSPSHTAHQTVDYWQLGSRAFFVAAAQVWNGLPEAVISSSSLQTFRRQLKTHLFQLSYPHLFLWLLVWHRNSGPFSNVVI